MFLLLQTLSGIDDSMTLLFCSILWWSIPRHQFMIEYTFVSCACLVSYNNYLFVPDISTTLISASKLYNLHRITRICSQSNPRATRHWTAQNKLANVMYNKQNEKEITPLRAPAAKLCIQQACKSRSKLHVC